MRIGGQDLLAECRLHPPVGGFPFGKLLEAAAGADRIDVPLGKNRTKPGLQRTAPVKVTEQGALLPFAASQAVQLGEKGIRKLAGFRRTCGAMKNRGGRGAQVRAVRREKVFPGSLASFGAGSRESQISNVEPAEIFFKVLRGPRSGSQALLCAAFERSRKSFSRNSPLVCFCLDVQPVDQGSAAVKRPAPIHCRALFIA